MAKPIRKEVPLASIIVNPELQRREEGLNQEHADNLSDLVKRKVKLAPVTLRAVPEMGLILTKGFHRYHGYQSAGRTKIPSLILPGTWFDCEVDASEHQQHEGLKQTNADKRRSVMGLLIALREEKARWSLSKIADHCGVSETVVQAVKKLMPEPEAEEPETPEEEATVGRDNKKRKKPRQAPRAKPAAADPETDWRGARLGEFLKVDDYAWPLFEEAKIYTAGELYDQLKAKYHTGLSAGDAKDCMKQLEAIRQDAEEKAKREAEAEQIRLFDWKAPEGALAAWVRQIHAIAHETNEQKSSEMEGLKRLAQESLTLLQKWQKRILKEKGK